MVTQEDTVGASEAARLLGVDRSTVTRMVLRGQLEPLMRLSGSTGAYLFRAADITALAEMRAS
jgi:excisionase family DNA binding protein